MGDSQTTKHLATGDVVPCLMCGLANRSVAPVRHEANDRFLSLARVQEDKEWSHGPQTQPSSRYGLTVAF